MAALRVPLGWAERHCGDTGIICHQTQWGRPALPRCSRPPHAPPRQAQAYRSPHPAGGARGRDRFLEGHTSYMVKGSAVDTWVGHSRLPDITAPDLDHGDETARRLGPRAQAPVPTREQQKEP